MILSEEDKKKLPKLYEQEKIEEKIVYLKIFVPWSNWTFFILEGEPDDDDFRMFAWVVGHEKELGYVSLNELEEIRGPGGLTLEKDLYFEPKPLKEVQKNY